MLSVIIPVYNRQASFDRLLSAVENTVDFEHLKNNVEFIIIDDYSESEIKISSLSSAKLIRNKENSGAPISRQEGFKISKCDFIHFHDSDDSISEDWLKNIIEELEKNSKIDILLTARTDVGKNKKTYKLQNFFNKNFSNKNRIEKRLIYRNCLGPLGGVTFSRRVLEKIEFKSFASCQDWQMYIDAIKHAEVLVSRPDIKFIFNQTGDDRISHNPRKKILGHLQLSKITAKESIFKRNIRLFYLYTCKQHIYNKGGQILKFYKKNRIKIFITFLVVSVYWRLT